MSKNKKIIIAVVAIAVIIAISIGAAVIGFILMSRGAKKENKKLEWGDIYLEVLEDDKKLEDMDDQQIQLCDLDKDSIPELIIYGIKNAKEYIANIYKINDKNEIDTVKVSLDKEFELKLLYDVEKDDYNWYAMTTEEKEPQIYDLNIETKKYTPEKIEKEYESNFIAVEDNYSKKVDFDKEASKSDKKKVLEDAKNEYVKTEDMITEEVKEKVEQLKSAKNISKLDPSKDLVYTAKEFKGSYMKLEYPIINIDSSEVKKINEEIKSKYGFEVKSTNISAAEGELMEQGFNETQEMSYDYYVYGTTLSVVPYIAGNESIWAQTYNIDLKTLKKLSSEDILKNNNLDKEEVIKKAKESAQKEFEKAMENDKVTFPNAWEALYNEEPDKYINQWKEALNKNIESLEKMYVDKNGDIYLLAEFEHLGGQWSCTKTLKINITKNYSVERLNPKTFTLEHFATRQTSPSPSPSTQATPKPTTSPSSSPTTTSSKEPTTKNAIGVEKAEKLAQSVWGTESDEGGSQIGYSYAGWGKDKAGKEYYIFNARWLVGDHWSYIGTICIAVDGKTYKQLDIVVNPEIAGDTFDMLDGGTF